MIPKIIHYCWFGGKPLSAMAEECIKSWKKVLPDYEIKRWDESNFDFSSCEFALKAYENKKWAFVADYFRAWVLYNYGGIYLDTDVKAIKSYDGFLNDGFFVGFEEVDLLEADTMGCEKNHPFAKAILDTFYTTKFEVTEDNNFYTMPKRVTDAFIKLYKPKRFYDKHIKFKDISLYPKIFFSPINFSTKKYSKSKKTYSVHLFNGSWLNSKTKPVNSFKFGLKRSIKKTLYVLLGYEATRKILGKK